MLLAVLLLLTLQVLVLPLELVRLLAGLPMLLRPVLSMPGLRVTVRLVMERPESAVRHILRVLLVLEQHILGQLELPVRHILEQLGQLFLRHETTHRHKYHHPVRKKLVELRSILPTGLCQR